MPYAETESGFQSGTIYLNTTQGDEDPTAACNAFYAAQKFRNFAKGDLGNAELDDYPLDLYVSKGFSPPYFNPGDAYQLGNEVHFAKSDLSTGFANMAYSTVLAHEMGHWANSKYGFTGTLGAGDGVDEAIADAWAMYIYDSNFIAENYNGLGTYVRDGNNLSQKCEGSSGCYGDAHLNGEPLMGALWDVRERVAAATAVGVDYPNALFRRIVTDSSIVFFGMEDAIRDIWLVTDDELDDSVDGFEDLTPYFNEINSSFVDHGWPEFGLNALTVNHVPPVDSPQNQPSFTIVADVALDPNFTSSAIANRSLVVRWSLDGVTQPSVTMTPTSQTVYEAVIVPSGGGGFVGPDVIDYYIEASYVISSLPPFQARFPAEGGHRISVGVQTLIYQNDFEGSSDQGWTHQELAVGLQDDWQRGYSYGASGVALWNSWFEPDTSLAGVENKVWGTDLGGPGLWNGEYNANTDSALLSPEIFIPTGAGSLFQISYKRWLTKGFSGEVKVTVKETASGLSIAELMPPFPDQIMDREWKSVLGEFVHGGAGGVQLEFSLDGVGGDNAGGWTIDDIEIYVLGGAPLPCGASLELPNTLRLSGNTAVSLGGFSYSHGDKCSC